MALSTVTPPAGTGARAGTDRCPGTVTVHQAADGGLARIRIPGGTVGAAALGALAAAATELGNGRLELTGRGNVQLRGLRSGAETELTVRLAALGLLPSPAHDRARNVLASPLSGRDGVGVLDVRPLVAELDRRLCADPVLAALPGRFLFALDDGRGDVAGQRPDVAALGLPDQRVALLLGGRDSGLRLPAMAAVTGLLAAATAFVRCRPDERVWRLAELPDGPLRLVSAVRSALGADAGSGPAVGLPDRAPRGPVGRIAQADGRIALAASVPLGELTPARCRLLAGLADRELVLTPWRGVLLPDLEPTAVEPAARRLAGAGLVLDPTSPTVGVTACTGRPGCAQALADVRADAAAVTGPGVAGPGGIGVAAGPGTGGVADPLPVHWSGCERRCGRPPGLVVDVVADSDGYQVRRDRTLHHVGSDLAAVRTAAALARASRR